MKKSIPVLRRESQIRDLLAYIISNDITNSNVINPTIIDCHLSNDLSHVKVFVSFSEKSERGLEALNNAKGFIRKILAKSLNWRKIPDVHFELDTLIDHGLEIDKILNDIKNEKKQKQWVN